MNISVELRYKQYIGDAAIPIISNLPRELYQHLSSAKTMQELAESEKARIKARTSQGADYLNNSFSAYAKSTIKQKEKKGRYGGVVNLFDTGNMLASMDDEGQERVGRLLFRTSESSAKAERLNNGTPGGRLKPRPFFQVSPNDEKNFVVILERKIAEWEAKNV